MTLSEARMVAMAVDETSTALNTPAIFPLMATMLARRFPEFKWYPAKLESGQTYLEVEQREGY